MNADTAYQTLSQQRDASLRHNFVCFALEGGFYGGGVAFVAFQAVLPRMVQSLGGSDALVAAVPLLFLSGLYLPQFFLAGWIERLPAMKPHTVRWGILQRIPFLVAGVALLLIPGDMRALALAAVVLAPFLTGMIGGMAVASWQELLAKCIPGRRLSSLWASRNIIAALIGMLAGVAVTELLGRWPGKNGYGLLFLCGWVSLTLSLLVFMRVREPSLPPRRAGGRAHWTELAREIPGRLRRDPRLRWFLVMRIFLCGVYIMLPFLSLRALEQLQQPESFLGGLLKAQMAGLLAGNLFGGWLGDRKGGRIVIVLELLGFMAVAIASVFAASISAWMSLFFLSGVFFALEQVGPMTLAVEISPLQERVSYLAMIGMAILVGLTSMTLLNIGLQSLGVSFEVVAGMTVASLCVALVAILQVKEPRGSGG